MNERIKQLALNAGIGFTLWDDSGRAMIDNYTPEERLTKFAELIVRECGDIAYNGYWDNPETVRGIHIKEKIKQHFGVE